MDGDDPPPQLVMEKREDLVPMRSLLRMQVFT